ncbi:class I SAM-dependent methyltransferase [Calycomorphotria hydatis]|uniref:Bifunctional 3-demethylubiquinone-9 3-methyltransferase/ 2-octaprenyl-6-hydroxy phenol methylase n=1 Tax=Calycomorphotria hydatis TaxID=2528027 RepID=A0A517TDK7_9PLAN|nr:class I SAM-dependent methyltransferase [Calycomorphotria hydatis]QDT66451.1 bifunctional 3-demethylubiquinone-9 3-methyltransferase/ 2-octaprenyl-6-hydroxy phenol methylase [Calycomorphotria hydatis]
MSTAEATTDAIPFNDNQSEAFAERLVGMLNESALSMMISIGYRTGLFDTMDGMPPSTSTEIADAAKLNERYVREWLGGMATGKIVTFHAENQTYQLPPENARWLTRKHTPENIAVTHQWTSVLGYVETQVIDKFQQGGGVHYDCFHRFHEVMADESAQTVVAALHEHILPLAEGMYDKLNAGCDVVDIGCGSGRAVCSMAKEFPNSRFAGYDLCPEAIEAATKEAARQGLTNVRFEARDITNLNESNTYDLVTAFDVIHDQKSPAAVLDQVYDILKPGGTYLMQDIRASSYVEKNMDHPIGPFLYTISTMHCMTVSLAQDGEGLGTVWGEELAVKMLNDAGFNDVRVETLDHDIINNYYIMKK